MTTPLSVTPSERISAQREAYQKALKGFAWGRAPESLFLMPPQVMEKMFNELEELRKFKAVNRQSFEEWISAPPYEREVLRYPDDETQFAWPGQYRNNAVQLAWEAWCQSRQSK